MMEKASFSLPGELAGPVFTNQLERDKCTMPGTDRLVQSLWNSLKFVLPRILGQLDRDADSPTFGSFDRDYWHYKMRDFSSIILQQGMVVLDFLYRWKNQENDLYQNPAVEKWIDGCLEFWAEQQLPGGGFNEYYAFEEGYPPTAFSLYAVGLVWQNRNFSLPARKIQGAIQKASDWLLKNPESQAFNQRAAGLAGLTLATKISGIRISREALAREASSFFSAQSSEGWFPEYGGADAGYLSVTIDCLADYYSITRDPRAKQAIDRAVHFIAQLLSVSAETPSMVNSRNTNYIVPYGIARAAKDNPEAAAVMKALLSRVDSPQHFFHHIDDRYTCHYIFQSAFRSLDHLPRMTPARQWLPCESGETSFLPAAGLFIQHQPGKKSIYVSGRKGGVVYYFNRSGLQAADFGWRAKLGKGKMACTHWQDEAYRVEYQNDKNGIRLLVRGHMTQHGWLKSTPLRHVVLRLMGFFAGKRIIPFLKQLMIFGKKALNIEFERSVDLGPSRLTIRDVFWGSDLKKTKLYRAPYYSLRHVASAGQFNAEELLPISPEPGKVIDGRVCHQRIITLKPGPLQAWRKKIQTSNAKMK